MGGEGGGQQLGRTASEPSHGTEPEVLAGPGVSVQQRPVALALLPL